MNSTRTAMSPGAAEMTASVTDTDTSQHEKRDKKHMIYKVVVNFNGQSWFIFRRYNEFHILHDKVRKLFPDADLKLPGKKLFSNLDPHFLRHRREGLNEFVQKLVSHDGLSQYPDVQAFLNIVPSHQRSSTDEEDTGTEAGHSYLNGKDDGHSSDEEKVNLGPSERPNVRPSDFEFLKVIGKGSFGKVLLAKLKSEDSLYAVKVLNKSLIMRKNEAKHIMSERNVLVQNVKHPFLVGLHFSFQTPDKLYFVLDYVNGGELFFHLQKERCFSESRSKFYAAEMASALGYLHSLNIIYRDLKPENILLDSQGHVTLTDFGLCKEGVEGRSTTSTFCGTPEYLAPEVLRKEPYDKTVDWWCLGSVLYEMLFGLPPFYCKNVNEMYENILHKSLRFRSNVASSSAKSILEGFLQKDKRLRLGAKNDFSEVQKHAFFSSLNWNHLLERKIRPPYNPNVADTMDLRHIDPEFTREPVPGSVGRSMDGQVISASVQEADHAFHGFSYVPPDEEAFAS